MPKTVLQLLKRYESNAPLINSMVQPADEELRTIVCYLSGEPGDDNRMEERAADTLYLKLPKKQVNWTHLATCRRVARLIDDYQVDLVVCQFRRPIPIGVIAAFLAKRKPKVIGVLHGIVGGRNSLSRKLVNYVVYKRLAKIVSVSEHGIDDIVAQNIALRRDRVTAIPNGVDLEKLRQAAETAGSVLPNKHGFTFLMVGRLAPVKNHFRVIQAFAQVVEQYPAAKLWIAGEGPERNRLEQLIEELSLTDSVILLGYRTDIPALLATADVFLMPSVREGLPMALMEAMVSGLPVITSDRAGMKELVPGSQYGYPVNPDSTNSLKRGLLQPLEESAEERKARAERGQERILNHYTADVMAAKYRELYLTLLSD